MRWQWERNTESRIGKKSRNRENREKEIEVKSLGLKVYAGESNIFPESVTCEGNDEETKKYGRKLRTQS